MKYFIIFLALFSSRFTWAMADFTLSTSYRSAPVTGGLKSELGYGLRLWGQGAFTGSLRPFLEAQASIGYSAYGAGLELNLWRFLGFKVNYLNSQNSDNYTSFNCELYRCQDSYSQLHYQVHSALRFGILFLTAQWKNSHFTPEIKDKSFIIPQIGLAATSQGESFQTLDFALGLDIVRGFSLFYSQSKVELGNSNSIQKIIGLRNVMGASFSMVLGVGTFESPLAKEDVMGVINFSWQPLRGFKIN